MDITDFDLQPTRDHYPTPKCRGGRRIVIACFKCNSMKGGMSAKQWHKFMDENPEWWNMPKAERRAKLKRERVMRQEGFHLIRVHPEKPSTLMAERLGKVPKICDKTLAPE